MKILRNFADDGDGVFGFEDFVEIVFDGATRDE